MLDKNFIILNESSLDNDDFFNVSLKSKTFSKNYEFRINKTLDLELLNIICNYHLNKIMESEEIYSEILEKLNECRYYEFFFKKNSEEVIESEKVPDITLDILDIDTQNFEVKILPYCSLYKSSNKYIYPTLNCKFDLFKNIKDGVLTLDQMLLEYSKGFISKVLDEEKNEPDIYSKKDVVVDDTKSVAPETHLDDVVNFGKLDTAYNNINFLV